MAEYINSNNIKVFPSSRRSDDIDRNARLTTEQNLTSLISRLSGIKSYIINGLQISVVNDKIAINPGSCSINGYYFNIKQIAQTNISADEVNQIYFKIELSTTTISTLYSFDELIGIDDSTDKYTGLEIVTSKPDTIPANQFYLLIGKKQSGNQWIQPETSLLRINMNEIKVGGSSSLNQNFTEVVPEESLESFLTNHLQNIIIDDGELE